MILRKMEKKYSRTTERNFLKISLKQYARRCYSHALVSKTSSQNCFQLCHRRTGLETWGGGGKHETAQLALKARKPLEGSGAHAPPESFEKQSPFNAFSCVLEWVFMHRASDE